MHISRIKNYMLTTVYCVVILAGSIASIHYMYTWKQGINQASIDDRVQVNAKVLSLSHNTMTLRAPSRLIMVTHRYQTYTFDSVKVLDGPFAGRTFTALQPNTVMPGAVVKIWQDPHNGGLSTTSGKRYTTGTMLYFLMFAALAGGVASWLILILLERIADAALRRLPHITSTT